MPGDRYVTWHDRRSAHSVILFVGREKSTLGAMTGDSNGHGSRRCSTQKTADDDPRRWPVPHGCGRYRLRIKNMRGKAEVRTVKVQADPGVSAATADPPAGLEEEALNCAGRCAIDDANVDSAP